jgi:hypothetical protein
MKEEKVSFQSKAGWLIFGIGSYVVQWLIVVVWTGAGMWQVPDWQLQSYYHWRWAYGLIVTVFIWIVLLLMMSGRDLTFKGLRKNLIVWDAKSISVTAICAAMFGVLHGIAMQFATWRIPIIPLGTWMFTMPIMSAFGAIFGVPGVVGSMIGVPIADALHGAIAPWTIDGSLTGYAIYAYSTYRLASKNPSKIKEYFPLIFGAFFLVYFWNWLSTDSFYMGTLLGIWPSYEILVFQYHPSFLPPRITEFILWAILTPLYIGVLLPFAKRSKLLWKDMQAQKKEG